MRLILFFSALCCYSVTRFVTYKGALHSQYAKAFAKDKQGNIFLIGDLDLIRIDNQVDTVIFRNVRIGTRMVTGSSNSIGGFIRTLQARDLAFTL